MRTRVVSIVTAPVRLLRRLLGLLPALFGRLRKLDAPVRRLARLRGRQRIAVLGILAVVIVIVGLLLRPGPDDEKDVRATLDRYAQASRDKDYQTLCDDLLATEIVDRIRNVGLPCEVALKTALEDRRNPTLTVLGVEVNGDQALARVRGRAIGEPAGTSTYRLVREDGGWRIATSPGSESQSAGAGP
jgi:ketosteroid isomerase-like protein